MKEKVKKISITRSKNMSRIRSKNTSIELLLGKAMWAIGLRYRKHDTTVFGKPDFVFKGKKVAIFCDSEFWHGKYLMEEKYIPKTNADYWIPKLERNIKRDKQVNTELELQGWRVVRFWEKDIRANPEECAQKVFDIIQSIK